MPRQSQRYWLMKSEPNVYGIDDLAREGRTRWEGVRNAQARNHLRDDLQEGNLVLFYHSSAEPPGVAGLARVCSPAYPDPTQFDPQSQYHDPRARPEEPRWWVVDVAYMAKLPRFVSLAELKARRGLDGMLVTRRGMRLSVQPVERKHFAQVLRLGGLDLREVLE